MRRCCGTGTHGALPEPAEEKDLITDMPAFEKLGIVADHVNRHPAMRQEVLNVYPSAKFHDSGHRLNENELIAFLADCDAAIMSR